MIEIARNTYSEADKMSEIELEGVHFKDGELVEQIMEICHKYKHLYKDGYPCGRKARKKSGIVMEKWAKCPEICFAYLITNDTKGHNLLVKILLSNWESLQKRFTSAEIDYYAQMFAQDVADEILTLD